MLSLFSFTNQNPNLDKLDFMYKPHVWKQLEALEAAAKPCDGARQLAFDFKQPLPKGWADPLHTEADVKELQAMIIVAKERLNATPRN